MNAKYFIHLIQYCAKNVPNSSVKRCELPRSIRTKFSKQYRFTYVAIRMYVLHPFTYVGTYIVYGLHCSYISAHEGLKVTMVNATMFVKPTWLSLLKGCCSLLHVISVHAVSYVATMLCSCSMEKGENDATALPTAVQEKSVMHGFVTARAIADSRNSVTPPPTKSVSICVIYTE